MAGTEAAADCTEGGLLDEGRDPAAVVVTGVGVPATRAVLAELAGEAIGDEVVRFYTFFPIASPLPNDLR